MATSDMATDSPISDFYRGRSIFITGGTGFMGKVLLEKLLRSCPDIDHVYLLMRPKKGLAIAQRLNELLESQLFSQTKNTNPDFRSKISAISGDMMEEGLGISQSDVSLLADNVSVVFHSAATVKFDEKLKVSIPLNVLGIRRLLHLAQQMKKLEAFVHVSTAYANCDKKCIVESVYSPPVAPNNIIEALDCMDTEVLETLTPRLIGDRPNTYTYSKALGESLLMEERGDLPVAIVRPSIVGASHHEPVPGWVDNLNGPTGLLAAIGKGLLRCMKGDFHGTSDIIPVDLAVNLMIAIAWYTATERPSNVIVYHCTTGNVNKLTWGYIERKSYEFFMKNPLNSMLRLPNPRFTKSCLVYDIRIILDQQIPAYIMDFYRWITGKKPMFVRFQDRLHKAVQSLDFFTCNQWEFTNDNIYMLLGRLTPCDKQRFNFDARVIDWNKYLENYCLGTKQYVLKEELKEMPLARRWLQRLKMMSVIFDVVFGVILWRLLISRVPVARSLWNLLIGWMQSIFQRLPRFAKSNP